MFRLSSDTFEGIKCHYGLIFSKQVKLSDYALAPRVFLLHIDGFALFTRCLACVAVFVALFLYIPEMVRESWMRLANLARTHANVCVEWDANQQNVRRFF